MILNVKFDGGSKGFSLATDLEIDIENDAESIGYITLALFEMANKLAEFCKTANPKYQDRINIGIAKGQIEKESEQNTNWPFTTFIQTDES